MVTVGSVTWTETIELAVIGCPNPVIRLEPFPLSVIVPVATVVVVLAATAATTGIAVTWVGIPLFQLKLKVAFPLLSAVIDSTKLAAIPLLTDTLEALTVPFVPVIVVVANLLNSPG